MQFRCLRGTYIEFLIDLFLKNFLELVFEFNKKNSSGKTIPLTQEILKNIILICEKEHIGLSQDNKNEIFYLIQIMKSGKFLQISWVKEGIIIDVDMEVLADPGTERIEHV